MPPTMPTPCSRLFLPYWMTAEFQTVVARERKLTLAVRACTAASSCPDMHSAVGAAEVEFAPHGW